MTLVMNQILDAQITKPEVEEDVIADFNTHGESHFYGPPCPQQSRQFYYGEKFLWLAVPQQIALLQKSILSNMQ